MPFDDESVFEPIFESALFHSTSPPTMTVCEESEEKIGRFLEANQVVSFSPIMEKSHLPSNELLESCEVSAAQQCTSAFDPSAEALVFTYGTLKRGFCNHYNMNIPGISFWQDGMTIRPHVLYLDHTNRCRPCLTNGATTFEHCQSNQSRIEKTTSEPSPLPLADDSQLLGCCCESDKPPSSTTSAAVVESASCTRCKAGNNTVESDSNNSENEGERSTWLSNYGSQIRGELYRVSKTLLPMLDIFEKVPTHYVRRTIRVQGLEDGKSYDSEVYFIKITADQRQELEQGSFSFFSDYSKETHEQSYVPRPDNREGHYHMNLAKKRRSTSNSTGCESDSDSESRQSCQYD